MTPLTFGFSRLPVGSSKKSSRGKWSLQRRSVALLELDKHVILDYFLLTTNSSPERFLFDCQRIFASLILVVCQKVTGMYREEPSNDKLFECRIVEPVIRLVHPLETLNSFPRHLRQQCTNICESVRMLLIRHKTSNLSRLPHHLLDVELGHREKAHNIPFVANKLNWIRT